jgi:hypothetical protein
MKGRGSVKGERKRAGEGRKEKTMGSVKGRKAVMGERRRVWEGRQDEWVRREKGRHGVKDERTSGMMCLTAHWPAMKILPCVSCLHICLVGRGRNLFTAYQISLKDQLSAGPEQLQINIFCTGGIFTSLKITLLEIAIQFSCIAVKTP